MERLEKPTDITGCILWLDGADKSTMRENFNDVSDNVVDGDPVGFWGDKTASGYNFLNPKASNRPTYVESLSSVFFNKLTTTSLTVSGSSLTGLSLNPTTIFVVTAPHAVESETRILSVAAASQADASGINSCIFLNLEASTSLSISNQGQYVWFNSHNTAPGHVLRTKRFNAGQSNAYFTALSSFDIFIHRNTNATNGLNNFVNGFTQFTGTNTATITPACMRLGAGILNGTTGTGDTANNYSGMIAEVIIFNASLNTSNFARVLNYLYNKWAPIQRIPRVVYALKNGNWSDTSLWSTSAYSTPFNLPLSADMVYTNGFAVTANVSTAFNSIRNESIVSHVNGGNSFYLANNVSLTGNIVNLTDVPAAVAIVNNNNNATFIGTGYSSSGNTHYLLSAVDSSTINFYGALTLNSDIYGASTTRGIDVDSTTSTCNFSGTMLIGNASSIGIRNIGLCNIVSNDLNLIFVGNANGASVIRNESTGVCNITGIMPTRPNSGFNYSFLNNLGTMNVVGRILPVINSQGGTVITNTGTFSMTGDIDTANGNISQAGGSFYLKGNLRALRNGSAMVITAGRSVIEGDIYACNAGVGVITNLTNSLTVIGGSLYSANNGTAAVVCPTLNYIPLLDRKQLYATGNSDGDRITFDSDKNNLTLITDFNPAKLVCGSNFAIAQSAGTTKWYGTGNGINGNFGDGNMSNLTNFTQLTGDWSDMYAGYGSVFALSARTAKWFVAGKNINGQLGLGSNTSPISNFTEITGSWSRFVVGGNHVLALSTNNVWFSTGLNSSGQLGLGDISNRSTFTVVSGFWSKIACGNNHTVALSTGANNALYVCGNNSTGEIGLGLTSNVSVFTRINGRYSDISAGETFTAIISAGTNYNQFVILTTGANDSGQLGLSNNNNRTTFNLVSTGLWDSVVCGKDFLFAKNIYNGYWTGVGKNLLGQLGNNTNLNTSTFSTTGTNRNLEIVCGEDFIYAVDSIYRPQVMTFTKNSRDINNMMYMYSEDSTLSMPLSSDVSSNVVYNYGALSGNMVVPPLSTVNAGVRVGDGRGSAYLSVSDFWNEPLSAIDSTPQSIGSYLKKTLTVNSLSSLINSLDFSKL